MKRVIEFLLANGYEEYNTQDPEFRGFHKNRMDISEIQVNEKEIVFINEGGDWLNIPCDIFALIGALLHFKEIAVDYEFVK